MYVSDRGYVGAVDGAALGSCKGSTARPGAVHNMGGESSGGSSLAALSAAVSRKLACSIGEPAGEPPSIACAEPPSGIEAAARRASMQRTTRGSVMGKLNLLTSSVTSHGHRHCVAATQ